MSVYRFRLASGEPKDIKFMQTALRAMFMFELSIDEPKGMPHELIARSYTEDDVSDMRKPKLVRAAGELKNRYGLNVEVDGYEKAAAEDLIIERYATFDDAVAICGLDAYYADMVANKTDGTPDFEMQYKFIYGKAPSKAQLEVFTDFMCGRTTMEHVVALCGKDAEAKNQAGPVNG